MSSPLSAGRRRVITVPRCSRAIPAAAARPRRCLHWPIRMPARQER